MYHLLTGTGHCKQVAENRVAAIRDNRSVAGYLESLESGAKTVDEIKPLIDSEVEAAKKAGLNFNMLAKIWLFDVGITEEGKVTDVPKFLNRVRIIDGDVFCCHILFIFLTLSFCPTTLLCQQALGMRLPKQTLMTDYFLKCLEKEIYGAKSAGTYDVGIKTLTGNNVQVDGMPRSVSEDSCLCLYICRGKFVDNFFFPPAHCSFASEV